MTLPRPSRPGAVLADLVTFFRSRRRSDYGAALLAVVITGFIVFAFNHDSKYDPGPQIVYVDNWPTTRSDAEIEAQQKIDSDARHKAEAERRAEFQKLADQLGIK